MTTSILYNNVELRNVQTLRFEQMAHYDESNTDLICHRFLITVEGTLHYDTSTSHVGIFPPYPTVFSRPSDVMRAVQAQLMHPRGVFIYAQGDHVLLRANPAPVGPTAGVTIDPQADVANGPKPIDCRITHVAGANVYRVQFAIEVNVVKCFSNSFPLEASRGSVAQHPWVLSNRWSMEETKDEEFFTTRTWDGVLRVRWSSLWPHLARNLCIPMLQRGFRRVSQRFVQSADGLWLRYTITDREMHAAPPSPAVDWRATYSESLGMVGTQNIASMSVSLSGAPGSNKRALFAAGIDVLLARLRGIRDKTDRGDAEDEDAEPEHHVILQNAMFVHHEHSNQIECRATIARMAQEPKTLWNLATEQIGTPLELEDRPEYDPGRWLVPTAYAAGTPAAFFATYLQTPCDGFHGITGQNGQSQGPDVQGGSASKDYRNEIPPEPEVFEDNSQEPPADAGRGRSDLQAFSGKPYTFAEIRQQYDTQGGRVHLPYSVAPALAPGAPVIPGPEAIAAMPQSGVFRIHAPLARRRVLMHFERVGAWPFIPAPVDVQDPNGIGETLLSSYVVPDAPELLPDGSGMLYKIQAEYVYGMARAPGQNDALRAGSDPADATNPQKNLFPASQFVPDGVIT